MPASVAPQPVRFGYRLSGFDADWSDPDSHHTVRYTNLPPGRYTFEVEAENSAGTWNRAGASFSFVLLPPFARTPMAYFCYVVFALPILWAAIAFRTRHLTRRQQELTRTVAERTAQLEAVQVHAVPGLRTEGDTPRRVQRNWDLVAGERITYRPAHRPRPR